MPHLAERAIADGAPMLSGSSRAMRIRVRKRTRHELEERAKNTVGEHELPAEIRDWFSWARNRAEAADPAFKSATAVVAENSSLHEWSYRDR